MIIQKSTHRFKKYMAKPTGSLRERWIHFGDNRYEQYKDSTPLKLYSHLNHGDKVRRRNYFMRHSKVATKKEAIARERERELRKSNGTINAKILSHMYLW